MPDTPNLIELIFIVCLLFQRKRIFSAMRANSAEYGVAIIEVCPCVCPSVTRR